MVTEQVFITTWVHQENAMVMVVAREHGEQMEERHRPHAQRLDKIIFDWMAVWPRPARVERG